MPLDSPSPEAALTPGFRPRPPSSGEQAATLRKLFRRLLFRSSRRARLTGKATDPVRQFILSLVLYALLGGLSFTFARLDSFAFAASLQAMTFVLIGMNLALSSGNVLFNPLEADVLLHRPIEPRALLRAKLRVIIEVSLALAIAMNVCGFVMGVRQLGTFLFLPAHLFSITLLVIFLTSAVILLYFASLRCFGRERMDNLLTTTQVLFAVAVMLGSQIVPRVVAHMDPRVFQHPPGWFALLPPTWFASLDLFLCGQAFSPSARALAALAVGATLLLGVLSSSTLVSGIDQGLLALNEHVSSRRGSGGLASLASQFFRLPLIRLWLADPIEQASFRLTVAGLTRARDVKLRVYPLLGQFLVCPTILLATTIGTHSAVASLPGTGLGLMAFQVAFAGAYIALLPVIVLEQLRQSDQWQATEIFQQAPLARPDALFQGARKAVVLLICGPAVLLLFAGLCLWLGPEPHLALLLPGVVAIPLLSLVPAWGRPFIPFAEPPQTNRGALGCLLLGGLPFVAGLIAGLAWFSWLEGHFGLMLAGEAAAVLLLSAWLRSALARIRLAPPE